MTPPRLRRSALRGMCVIGGIAIVLMLLLLWRTLQPTGMVPHGTFNTGTNAAWLGVEWVHAHHESDEIGALGQNLARLDITDVYVFTTYLKASGEFNSTYAHAAEFVETIKTAQPGLNVYAWIGLPLAESQPRPGSAFTVVLGDAATRGEIVALCRELVHVYGFDGVHLDPEPVMDGDLDLLTLLEELRDGMHGEGSLSVATRRIWPFSLRIPLRLAGRFSWSHAYYGQVAEYVDQVAVMVYDSALPLPGLYRRWVQCQVVSITQALKGADVEVFIGVPTSEEKTWTHWPRAENMTSGLGGIIAGLGDKRAEQAVFTGVAIYPYWETDPAEWATYESLWLGR